VLLHSFAAASLMSFGLLDARTLDDVGYTLDRHHDTSTPISMGIGKHTNDHMVSFYSVDEQSVVAELDLEAGRRADKTWTVTQVTKPSFWGHRPPAAT
jgi:3,4-dihydroxy-9,10-secoandrosta-1,3,5(10)-triene-9,17-dione 4,5-dioxygenase